MSSANDKFNLTPQQVINNSIIELSNATSQIINQNSYGMINTNTNLTIPALVSTPVNSFTENIRKNIGVSSNGFSTQYAGVYEIVANGSFTSSKYISIAIKIMVNGVQPAYVYMTSTGLEFSHFGINTLKSLSVNDTITFQIENLSSIASDLTNVNISFIAKKLIS
jgi:hypothetical protein